MLRRHGVVAEVVATQVSGRALFERPRLDRAPPLLHPCGIGGRLRAIARLLNRWRGILRLLTGRGRLVL